MPRDSGVEQSKQELFPGLLLFLCLSLPTCLGTIHLACHNVPESVEVFL